MSMQVGLVLMVPPNSTVAPPAPRLGLPSCFCSCHSSFFLVSSEAVGMFSALGLLSLPLETETGMGSLSFSGIWPMDPLATVHSRQTSATATRRAVAHSPTDTFHTLWNSSCSASHNCNAKAPWPRQWLVERWNPGNGAWPTDGKWPATAPWKAQLSCVCADTSASALQPGLFFGIASA